MPINKKFVEEAQVVNAFPPVDMSAADNNGDWVNLANFDRCIVILTTAIGTAGDDPIFKLQQATDKAGAGAKDLLFTVIDEKVGATALSGVGEFTRVTQTAATSYVNTDSAENEAIITVEVRAEQLDSDNDFTHIQLSVADVGANAQIGVGEYILYNARYPQATLQSAID